MTDIYRHRASTIPTQDSLHFFTLADIYGPVFAKRQSIGFAKRLQKLLYNLYEIVTIFMLKSRYNVIKDCIIKKTTLLREDY